MRGRRSVATNLLTMRSHRHAEQRGYRVVVAGRLRWARLRVVATSGNCWPNLWGRALAGWTSIQVPSTTHAANHGSCCAPTYMAACIPVLTKATITSAAHATASLYTIDRWPTIKPSAAAAATSTTTPPAAAPLSEEVAGAADHLEEFGVDLLVSFT